MFRHPQAILRGNRLRIIQLIAVMALLAIFGSLIRHSHAAIFAVSKEAESGSLSGNQGPGESQGASGNASIKFGTATPTPSPTPPPPAPGSSTCANPSHTLPMTSDPQSGITLNGFYITNDTWNAAGYQVSQTLYICDYNSWYVTATMNNNNGDGAVKTYPNVHKDFKPEPKISSYTAIPSSFAESGPHVGIYEYAYDIWLNGVAANGSTEVMIWNDNYGQTPSGDKQATFSSGGRTYDVYNNNSGYIAFVDTANRTSGNVDLLAFFNFIISKGWIPSTSTIGQIDYGPELVSTDNKPATFYVNDFSLTLQ